MTEPPAIPAAAVNSLFINLETLLAGLAPGWSRIGLGVRWGFDLGALDDDRQPEYALPAAPLRFAELVARRSGFRLHSHSGAAASGPALAEHLAAGRPAIVAVDSHDLPYRPAFGRVHSGRTVVIRRSEAGDGAVRVDDPWPPTWSGPLAWAALETARWSEVPADRRLEPVFSGVPTAGQWWHVSPEDRRPAAPDPAWLLSTLAAIGADARAMEAVCGLTETALRLERGGDGPAGWGLRRRAALALRAEISSRVYLHAFLDRAARALDDGLLAAAVLRFGRGLGRAAHARDLLVKSLAHGRPGYLTPILADLKAAAAAERHLAETVAGFADFAAITGFEEAAHA